MQDRFKFRCFNKFENKMFDVRSMSYINGIVKRIEVQGEESLLIFDEWEKNIDNTILMQCTGLKDKNGKLIYEGDIVRYAEYEIEEIEPEWEYTEIVWGGKYDYPAFDLKKHNFDSNGLSEIIACGWTIEVMGNIYENKDLINDN